jgi:UPF0755 protein
MFASVKKWFIAITLLLLLSAACLAYVVFSPATEKAGNWKINRGSDLSDIKRVLNDSFHAHHLWCFPILAKVLKYENPKPALVAVKKGMSLYEVIRMLKANLRQTVNITIQPGFGAKQIARQLGKHLEPDAQVFDSLLRDNEFLLRFGADARTWPILFVPETYNLYYAAAPEDVFRVFNNYSKEHWAKLGLRSDSLVAVITLASIVEKESQHADEKPRVAGVYLNRLKKGKRLQADPTVNFALDEWRALTYKDYEFPSPYNTYLHEGLPPGPICIPGQTSVKAVLEPEQHQFMFFVARGDGSGYHRFSENYDGHLRNIGIRKKERTAP